MLNDTIYTHLGGSDRDGIFACGYMEKDEKKSQLDFCIPYYSIFVLLEGSGLYKDETGAEYKLAAGSVVQRLPGVVHSTIVDNGSLWREFFISFGYGCYCYLKDLGYIKPVPPVTGCELKAELTKEFDEFHKAMKRDVSFSRLLTAQSLVAKIFTQCEAGSDLMLRAKDMLNSNLHVRLKESQIAKSLGLGLENFRKLFKESFGISPMQFRIDQRINAAKAMLLSGMSVKEVVALTGYSDRYAFAKQFKKKTGETPIGFVKPTE